MEFELLGYTEADKTRHEKTLLKLIPYLESHEFVLVGGDVIRYFATKNGLELTHPQSNDIDIIISSLNVLSPNCQKDFMVCHYHNYPEPAHEIHYGDRFYVVLVDAETKLKADLFDYTPYVPHEPVSMNFHGHEILIRNIEDQLCTAVLEGSRILSDMKQFTKKFNDIDLMLKIADLEKAEKYWSEAVAPKPFSTLKETYAKMQEKAKENPTLVEEKDPKKDPYACDACSNANGFTVTPMDVVYKALE